MTAKEYYRIQKNATLLQNIPKYVENGLCQAIRRNSNPYEFKSGFIAAKVQNWLLKKLCPIEGAYNLKNAFVIKFNWVSQKWTIAG